MIQTLTLGVFVTLCVAAFADELLIASVVDPHAQAIVDKFSLITNQDALEKAIKSEAILYKSIENTVHSLNSKRRIMLGKLQMKTIIDDLTNANAHLAQILLDLVKIKAKAHHLEGLLSHNDYSVIIEKLAKLEKDALHLQKHTTDLIAEFDCKFKRRCFEDDFKTAKNTLWQKIGLISDVEHGCPGFTKECADKYKVVRKKFAEFDTDRVKPLYTTLDAVCNSQCFVSDKQRVELNKDLLELDTRTKGWVLTIKSKLKKLVEKKLLELNEVFVERCHELNTLKIAAKDNSGDVSFIQNTIQTLNTTSLEQTDKLLADFLDVYELLLHLADLLLDDELFTECYKHASTMFYLFNGFKQQINDCVKELSKTVIVSKFRADLDAATAKFNTISTKFHAEEALLLSISEIETCPHTGRLLESFGQFKVGLSDLGTTSDALILRFNLELEACKSLTAVGQIHTDLNTLKANVISYADKNRRDLCFLEVFNDVFCRH